MRFKPLPTVEVLRGILDYSPEAGDLIWRINAGRVRAGQIAGRRSATCIVITIGGIKYAAHRLIWKLMTGQDPLVEIDHKDVDPMNNKWVNLRLATSSQNKGNRGAQSDNLLGLKGIRKHQHSERWQPRICKDGINYYLGIFPSLEEASAAYEAKAVELFGEFARVA